MPNSRMKKLTFADLFAGIGGFHLAMQSVNQNSECVFACEIDKNCNDLYKQNFGINPIFDIREVEINKIPPFQILFAGFPCQPFSKGGNQKGFTDRIRGTLFFNIMQIIEHHQPTYILLENVANIITHDGGYTYQVIKENLLKNGYYLPKKPLILSPSDFGIPIHRKRAYIIARKINKFESVFKITKKINASNINNALDYYQFKAKNDDELQITKTEHRVLNMWDEFKKGIINDTFGFPIWIEELNSKKPLKTEYKWKNEFIRKNKLLYINNQEFIDQWLEKHKPKKWITNKSHMKFEWQAKDLSSVFEGLIQFRPSGIRVSSLKNFNTLVAMGHTQIIGPYKRRLSIDELKQLQSFPSEIIIAATRVLAAKQIGNSVHLDVVKEVIHYLIDDEKN